MTHRPASSHPAPHTHLPPIAPDHLTTVHQRVRDWFAKHARPLPWRDRDASPWSILVCEVMSQQTPIARVLPRWEAWMRTWPTPSDLAAAPVADVLVAWDSLGYPRRALRLQETARAIAQDHSNHVPHDEQTLRSLPGVGAYTASAVASFAYGQHSTVLDVNVRRVLGRVFAGVQHRPASLTAAEQRWASALVPSNGHVEWNAGAMELGALICTARSPSCDECPLAQHCAWFIAGRPEDPTAVRRAQSWAGTDRQLRGAIMRVLRTADAHPDVQIPVRLLTEPAAGLTASDADALADLPDQVSEALTSARGLDSGGERTARLVDDLVRDGLATRSHDLVRLP